MRLSSVLGCVVRQALAQTGGDDLESRLVQRSRNSGQLSDDVRAVAALLDH